MAESSSSPTPAEVLPAALLFEDDSVVVEEVPNRRRNGVEDVLMGVEDVDSVSREHSLPPSSASPHDSASASPSAGGSSRTSTTPPASTKPKGKPAKKEPQLIGDLPRAEEDAMRTFTRIPENNYQYNTLGRSREGGEGMICDCQYEHGVDDPSDACGLDSDCINRLTQVECMPDDCRCRSHCQNQRFQRKQYAPIHIVQTEKKGFGLRAAENIRKDSFIYEYVGDVVNQNSFLKRMRLYAEEGIRHFYFMMLQKDEFIDATKKGGIGRFANHSCNPNCYVAKWTVGSRVRMGIFANRLIKKDEELTFNYNVDRYGHDAQPCYCGEDKCVGFIGGKTQTDLAAMDDLYLDALGITDEVEEFGLKGNKKKKGKKLDVDFVPDMKPLLLTDVPKVVQAMRQTQSRKVLIKLLTRISKTEDPAALRQIMRLRGFSVMTNIMHDYENDSEVILLAMECMSKWPLIQRNKVHDSGITAPVTKCLQSEDQTMVQLAQSLIDQWAALDLAYRIPKRVRAEGEEAASQLPDYDQISQADEQVQDVKRPRREPSIERLYLRPNTMPRGSVPRDPMITKPQEDLETAQREWRLRLQKEELDRKSKVAEILKQAAVAAEMAADFPQPLPKEEEASRKKSSKPKQSKEEKEALKEKRLMKLVGAVVVKYLSKYQKQMDNDTFKNHAKHLTQKIAEREKKSSSYKEGKLESLSDEKVEKIKKYCKEYVAKKVLRKLESGGSRHHSSSSSKRGSSSNTARPPHDDGDVDMDLSHDKPWGDAQSDEEDGSDHHPSPEDSSSSRRSVSEAVSDPRVRFRQEPIGKHQVPSLPSSPRGPKATSFRSVSMVSVGHMSR